MAKILTASGTRPEYTPRPSGGVRDKPTIAPSTPESRAAKAKKMRAGRTIHDIRAGRPLTAAEHSAAVRKGARPVSLAETRPYDPTTGKKPTARQMEIAQRMEQERETAHGINLSDIRSVETGLGFKTDTPDPLKEMTEEISEGVAIHHIEGRPGTYYYWSVINNEWRIANSKKDAERKYKRDTEWAETHADRPIKDAPTSTEIQEGIVEDWNKDTGYSYRYYSYEKKAYVDASSKEEAVRLFLSGAREFEKKERAEVTESTYDFIDKLLLTGWGGTIKEGVHPTAVHRSVSDIMTDKIYDKFTDYKYDTLEAISKINEADYLKPGETYMDFLTREQETHGDISLAATLLKQVAVSPDVRTDYLSMAVPLSTAISRYDPVNPILSFTPLPHEKISEKEKFIESWAKEIIKTEALEKEFGALDATIRYAGPTAANIAFIAAGGYAVGAGVKLGSLGLRYSAKSVAALVGRAGIPGQYIGKGITAGAGIIEPSIGALGLGHIGKEIASSKTQAEAIETILHMSIAGIGAGKGFKAGGKLHEAWRVKGLEELPALKVMDPAVMKGIKQFPMVKTKQTPKEFIAEFYKKEYMLPDETPGMARLWHAATEIPSKGYSSIRSADIKVLKAGKKVIDVPRPSDIPGTYASHRISTYFLKIEPAAIKYGELVKTPLTKQINKFIQDMKNIKKINQHLIKIDTNLGKAGRGIETNINRFIAADIKTKTAFLGIKAKKGFERVFGAQSPLQPTAIRYEVPMGIKRLPKSIRTLQDKGFYIEASKYMATTAQKGAAYLTPVTESKFKAGGGKAPAGIEAEAVLTPGTKTEFIDKMFYFRTPGGHKIPIIRQRALPDDQAIQKIVKTDTVAGISKKYDVYRGKKYTPAKTYLTYSPDRYDASKYRPSIKIPGYIPPTRPARYRPIVKIPDHRSTVRPSIRDTIYRPPTRKSDYRPPVKVPDYRPPAIVKDIIPPVPRKIKPPETKKVTQKRKDKKKGIRKYDIVNPIPDILSKIGTFK